MDTFESRRRMMMGGKKKFTISYSGLKKSSFQVYAYIENSKGEVFTGDGALTIAEGDYITCKVKGNSSSSLSEINKDGVRVAAANTDLITYVFYPESDAEITIFELLFSIRMDIKTV